MKESDKLQELMRRLERIEPEDITQEMIVELGMTCVHLAQEVNTLKMKVEKVEDKVNRRGISYSELIRRR